MNKISFNQLSTSLKIPIVFSWIMLIFWLISFIAGFILTYRGG